MASAGWIEDRWLKKRKDPVTGKRERTELWGTKTKRYRVCGIPGVRRRSFETLDEAKTWMAKAIVATKKKDFVDDRDGELLLGTYITAEWWPSREYDDSTAGPMKSRIFNHIVDTSLGRTPMFVIGDTHLGSWKKELQGRRLAESTIEVVWAHLGTIMQSAVGKKIAVNPCRVAEDNVRPKGAGESLARAWTLEEARAIREEMAPRYRIIPDVGLKAGARQGEAFGLSLDDLDEGGETLHIRRQLLWDNGTTPYLKLPKGRKQRSVPASPGLIADIRAHVDAFPVVTVTLPWRGPGNHGRPTATVRLLATTAHGNRIHPSTFNARTMKPALAAAGLIADREEGERWGWEASREMMHHRWRHTYASVQLAGREDIVSVSHWMGHASVDITARRYAHFMPDKGTRGRTAVDFWLSS
ncbi:tyrosine-type recombinase/integrase [Streptomyces rubiginosohelvolus]|uniref:tyrosine-type recombinase/integrase n=1 Tax=Streptomyces rubiginosohelvolus TaxID=67362 RepID=UPI003720DF37